MDVFACLFALSEFTLYGLEIFFFCSASFWICFGVWTGIFAILFSSVYVVSKDSKVSSWWHNFPDNMQDFYNRSKVIRWLELFNIKYPTNNIELPPQQININFPKKPIGSYVNLLNGRESDINGNSITETSPESINNDNKTGNNDFVNPIDNK